MWQLELVLLLHNSNRKLTLAEISRALYLNPDIVFPVLKRFVDDGILCFNSSDAEKYSFAPKNPELRKSVDAAAQAYAERRTAVIEMIFSKPIQSFADAFILKQEED